MRHHHRWPYILVPLLFCLPTLITATSPSSKTRHFQRQIHRLVGGHLRIEDADSNDSELITASAGDNSKSKKGSKGDDERKTLSQQVADGKYGLIQKELFQTTPKRPGIISYTANPEIPKDNIATLGGLTKSDIWLAENHLLVIKGGTYPPHDDTKQEHVGQIWQPFDDYNAPLHQVKIPKNPKIPPPFPVQLTDDGPLQILGTNSSRTLNESAETPAYALPPPPGWDGEIPPQNEYFPQTGNGTDPEILDEDDPSIYYPPPYSFYYPKDNSSLVPPGPLVPGIILPPPPKFFAALEDEPGTTTKRPYSRPVHVPIHHTEPPLLTNEITTPKPIKTIPTRVTVVKNYSKVTMRVGPSRKTTQPSRTQPQTTKLIKTTIPTTEKPKIISILPVHVGRLNRTYLPAKNVPSTKKRPAVTILRPVKPEIVTPKVYLYRNKVSDRPNSNNEQNTKSNQAQEYEASPGGVDQSYKLNRGRPYNSERQKFSNHFISSTQIPLKYHSTTQDAESHIITQQPEKFSIGINAQYPKTTSKPAANFFFYEETDPSINLITTEKPIAKPNPHYYEPPNQYFHLNQPTQAPSPIIKSTYQPAVRPHFVYVNDRPKLRYVPQNEVKQKQNTFSVHVAKLQHQLHQYYTTPGVPVRHSSKPVYQYSFEAQNYRPTGNKNFRPSPLVNGDSDSFKPMPKYSVQIQQAIEIVPTQQPSYQQIQPLNVEEPSYFSTERPQNGYSLRPSNNYNPQYQQEVQKLQGYIQPNKNSGYEVTPAKAIAEFSFEATPNPLHQGFYTEPDEGYFDERTRQSFTVFGRKLPSATTPVPVFKRPITRPNSSGVRQQESQPYRNQGYNKPISLESDINVNYANPRPPINPESEPIPQNPQYYEANQQGSNSHNPEIIKAIEITPGVSGGGRNEYIQYQLPGDEGAHFYFLPPQQAERRRQPYSYQREDRVRRDGRKIDNEKGLNVTKDS